MKITFEAKELWKLLETEVSASATSRTYWDEIKKLAFTIAKEATYEARESMSDAEDMINLANAHVAVLIMLEGSNLRPTLENQAVVNSTKAAIEQSIALIEMWMEKVGLIQEDLLIVHEGNSTVH